jgi:hypothetical protein
VFPSKDNAPDVVGNVLDTKNAKVLWVWDTTTVWRLTTDGKADRIEFPVPLAMNLIAIGDDDQSIVAWGGPQYPRASSFMTASATSRWVVKSVNVADCSVLRHFNSGGEALCGRDEGKSQVLRYISETPKLASWRQQPCY